MNPLVKAVRTAASATGGSGTGLTINGQTFTINGQPFTINGV